jgi:hypothetical protein
MFLGYRFEGNKYEMETRVPRCEELCGIFGVDINQFIEAYVRERLRKMGQYDIEDVVEDI